MDDPIGDGTICLEYNTMNDYDDDGGLGNGRMDFSGAEFDFYTAQLKPVTVRANGYEQDCVDNHFGDHGFRLGSYVDCYTLGPLTLNGGQGDAFGELAAQAAPSSDLDSYRFAGISGSCVSESGSPNQFRCAENGSSGEYELEFTLTEHPLGNEIRADLRLTKNCDDRVLEGEPFACRITIENLGPGLPSQFRLSETLSGVAPGVWTLNRATAIVEYGDTRIDATQCKPIFDVDRVECALPSVPVGGRADITLSLTIPRTAEVTASNVTDAATIVGAGDDPNPSNNQDQDTVNVVQIVGLDIRPGEETNPVKVGTSGGAGRIAVAILSTPDFNTPARVDTASLTFGRAGDEPSLASCANKPEDVNRDGLRDLVSHFTNDPRLFQASDTEGILRGQTLDSPPILIQGSDRVTPVP